MSATKFARIYFESARLGFIDMREFFQHLWVVRCG